MSYNLIKDQILLPDFQGEATKFTYEFEVSLPDQTPLLDSWLANKCISEHNRSLAEAGTQLIRIRVWEDKAPTWSTRYQVECIAAGYGSEEAISSKISVAWLIWAAIIGALALLAAFITYKILLVVDHIVNYIPKFAWNLAAVALVGLVAIGAILVLKPKNGQTSKKAIPTKSQAS